MPALTESIRELGLAIIADTSDENPPPSSSPAPAPMSVMNMFKNNGNNAAPLTSPGSTSSFRMPEGVNGVMRGTGVLRFNDSVDM